MSDTATAAPAAPAPAPAEQAPEKKDQAQQAAPPPPPPTPEQKAEAKKWKLKVGGKDVEADERELIKRAQMGYSADEKWQEASRVRKEMEALVQLLQSNPAAALERLGHDVDGLAERRIQQRIEEMKKSPEQREREEMQRKFQKLEQEKKAMEEQMRQRELVQIQEKFAVDIENDILGAFETDKEFPNSPYVVKRVADLMIYAMQNGHTEIKAADVLPVAKRQIHDELREMYNLAPDDVFEALIGKDRLNKYRKSRVKRKPAEQPPASAASSIKPTGEAELKTKGEEKPKTKNARDFFRNLR